MTLIKTYLDVGSPYSYVAFELLRRHRHVWDVTVEFVPVLLGAVLKATGNHSPVAVPAKAAHTFLDIQRTCRLASIPFTGLPANFADPSFSTLPALRMLVAAQQLLPSDAYETVLQHVFLALFGAQNLTGAVSFDANFLTGCCRAAGIAEADTSSIMAAVGSERVKAQLKANTADALSLGMYGAPFLVVHGHPKLPPGKNHFFGSDRLEQMATLMGKPWHGVQIPSRAGPSLSAL